MFSDLGISGSHLLGGFVGECSMASDYVAQKAKMWVDCIKHLSDVAKSLGLLMLLFLDLCNLSGLFERVIPNCATAFVPLRDAIHHQFYLAVLGGPVSEFEVQLFDLPARASGLGISYPMESASMAFTSSLRISAVFQAAISVQAEFSPAAHLDILDAACHEASANRGEHIQSVFISFVILDILVYKSCH